MQMITPTIIQPKQEQTVQKSNDTFSKENVSARVEILEAIREFPGSSSREIATLLPNLPESTVFSIISKLLGAGVIKTSATPKMITMKDGRTKSQRTFEINMDYMLKSRSINGTKPKSHARIQNLEKQVAGLKAEVSALTAWKNAALKRFPDLAVSPIMLKARKIAANTLYEADNSSLADAILAGKRDDHVAVKIAIEAMKDAQ